MAHPRILGPKALSEFYVIFDEIWRQLLDEGVVSRFDTHDMRAGLAKKVLAFDFPSRWSRVQIKQLLIRAIRLVADNFAPTRESAHPSPQADRLEG